MPKGSTRWRCKRTKGGHLCPVVGCRGNVEVEEVAAEAAAADDDEEPRKEG